MDNNIALLIIYNHRYDKNIPILEEIFKGKFSNIYHIVPFYDGDRENVLPVYESSFYFSGYISQALNQIKDKTYTHYVFTSDDLMLNPQINENNILSLLCLENNESFIPRFRSLQDPLWARSLDALGYYYKGLGAEVERMLPTKDKAIEIFQRHGCSDFKGVSSKIAWKIVRKQMTSYYNWYQPTVCFLRIIKTLLKRPFGYFEYRYPQIGGYNDFFVVSSLNIEDFKKYCGAFAASKMFVEIAIPTSLLLASDKIKTASDTNLKCGDLWLEEVKEFEKEYEFSLKKMFDKFPNNILYRHPVKLSKWK